MPRPGWVVVIPPPGGSDAASLTIDTESKAVDPDNLELNGHRVVAQHDELDNGASTMICKVIIGPLDMALMGCLTCQRLVCGLCVILARVSASCMYCGVCWVSSRRII